MHGTLILMKTCAKGCLSPSIRLIDPTTGTAMRAMMSIRHRTRCMRAVPREALQCLRQSKAKWKHRNVGNGEGGGGYLKGNSQFYPLWAKCNLSLHVFCDITIWLRCCCLRSSLPRVKLSLNTILQFLLMFILCFWYWFDNSVESDTFLLSSVEVRVQQSRISYNLFTQILLSDTYYYMSYTMTFIIRVLIDTNSTLSLLEYA